MISLRPSAIYLMLISLSLTGCASMFNPIGENKYDCNRKENPNSPYCHSFRAVEQATSNDVPDSRYDQKMNIADTDKLTGIAPINNSSSTTTHDNQRSISPITTLPTVSNTAFPAGTPVRIAPVIQRIWIKSFNDKNDMLTSDQVVYKEVVPPHWAGQTPNQITPGASLGGLPGAYPHKPTALPVTSTSTVAPLVQSEQRIDNASFSQPGSQAPVGETGSALPDISATTMPK